MWEVLAALIQKQKFCAKFIGKHLHQSLFYNKVAGLRPEACNFVIKETLTQAFSCELCEISKNTFFTEHLWMTASASTKYMEDYKKPWIRDEPDHFILYVGFNDLNFKLWSDSIVESMVNLPMSLKTKLNDVSVFLSYSEGTIFV